MPPSKDVGRNMKALNESGKPRPYRQKLAIALSEAREAGNKSIPPPPKKKKRKKKDK